ncbi:MAG: FtsX-like permease family protein, partial [Candidatus Hodarchaeota archaeon]
TNSTGNLRFRLTDAGNYTIHAFKSGFTWNNFVFLSNQTTKYNISLGNVRLIIFTKSVSEYPISGIGVSTFRSSILQTEITNSSGMLEMIVPIGNYLFLFTTVGYMSSLVVNLTYSQIFWINKTIESCGNLTINLENQLYQPLGGAFIFLRNSYYNYEIKAFTDTLGKISLHGIPWGAYSIHITYDDYIAPRQIIEFSNNKTEVTIQVDTEGPLINAGSYAFWQDRGFSVVWSSEYISGFLESTLSLITTTLTTLIIIVSVLSLLSIASVISHPIVSNERTLLTFQYLGADRKQVVISVVLRLILLGLIASVVGAVFGMFGMTIIPQFQHINIGGVIIRPRVDFSLLLAILVSNVSVIAIKAGQKVNELYSRHLPRK